MDMTVFLLFCQ